MHAIAPKLTLDGGGAAVQPEPEGAEPWKGIFEDGEVRRRGMRDEEDGVERCGQFRDTFWISAEPASSEG